MFDNLWWVYVAVGILLVIVEIFTPNFVIMWFGISSIISAIPVYLGASTKIVILTYTVSLLILTLFVRKITVEHFSKTSKGIKTNVSHLVGKHGIVTHDIDIITSQGMVRVGKELWSAITESNQKISENEQIIVCGIDGVKLIVRKREDG